MDLFYETNLIIKSKNGDIESFEKLIAPHMKKCYNIALGYTHNTYDAEDISQNAIVKIFQNLKNFESNSRLSTWIYRIVINECHNYQKSNTKNRVTENQIECDVDDLNTPENNFIQKEKIAILYDCLDKLGDEKKEILMLRDIQNFSYNEISNILDISLGTVKSRISRAREELKSLICRDDCLIDLLNLIKEVHCG